jgi:CheY-like chemotaxis protein
VKFTPKSGSIHLGAHLLGEENGVCTLQIEVTDTGIGISEEQRSRLFTSFEQAESSTTRQFGGTGLGLAISKRTVEMMNGRIWLESEPGKGSTFAFTVQAKRGADEYRGTGSPIAAKEETAPGSDSFRGCRLLLAEDVEVNREIVLALLTPTALEIDCAEDGAEVVRLYSKAPDKYDMIFMDVQMPKMDGYEATRRIRILDVPGAREVPIVAMTANVFREDIDKCLEAGMNDHVGKPLDFDEVLSKLRKYLPQKYRQK